MTALHRFYSCFVLLAATLSVSCAPADDNSNAVQVADVTVNNILEGNSGQRILTFSVTSAIGQRIRYETVNITAAAGSDFMSLSGEWLMTPGVTRTVDVPVLGDLQVEADERVGLKLTYSNGSSSLHEGIILNDDRPLVSVTDQRVVEGAAGTTVMQFTLRLSQTTLTAFPVRVLTNDVAQTVTNASVGNSFQPATANSDYRPIDQELIFPAGANTARIEVLINGDTDIESGEAFSLQVFDTGADPLTDDYLAVAYGLIINDDGPGFNMPEVTLSSSQAQEGASGTNNTINFPLSLTGPNDVDISIFYQIVFPDTAANGFNPADSDDLQDSSGKFRDIVATGQNISINDSIPIFINGDDQYELDEYFELVLTTAAGYELARARGVIRNDDTPRFTLTNATLPEGNSGISNMQFTIRWDEPNPLGEEIRLKYRTKDGFSDDFANATSGIDYEFTSGSLIFQPGEVEKTIDVAVFGDLIYEPNEAFTLEVSTEAGAHVVSARGVIENEDQPRLTVTPEDGSQIDEDAGSLSFIPSFVQSVTRNTTLYWVIKSGSATVGITGTVGADVTADSLTGEILFPEDEKTSPDMPVSVTVVDDSLVEGTESFSLSFYSSQADAINERAPLYQSRISIIDNDAVIVEFSKSAFRGREGNVDGSELALSELSADEASPKIRIFGGIIENDTSVSLILLDPGTTDSNDLRFTGDTPITVSIPAGNYTAGENIDIPGLVILSDTVLENDETLTLELINPAGTGLAIGTRNSLAITILNDDSLVVGFSSTADISGTETNPTAIPALRALTAVASNYYPDGPGGVPLTVTLDLLNPGAVGQAEREDFTPNLPVQLTIADLPIAADDILTTTMPAVLDDDLVELDENATLVLTAAANSLVSVDSESDRLNYNLISDDSITLTLDTAAVVVDEGSNVDIPIQISGGRLDDDSPPLTFELTVTPESGTEAADYSFGGGLVTIPGNTDYSEGISKSDWLHGELILIQDGLVEGPEQLTIGLKPIDSDFTSVLAYSASSNTLAVTINSNDTLAVEFNRSQFESFENDTEPESAIRVDGLTEIEVELEFERVGGESYPADEGVDVSLAVITIPPTHSSGATYDFPAVALTDTETEFNEQMSVRFRTGAQTGEPIELQGLTMASWLLLNDDLTLYVNGSGIDYCADSMGDIKPDCGDVTDTNLQTQDGKEGTQAFIADPSNRNGDDSGSPALTWQCRIDARTSLTWAFEDSATPQVYTDTEVTEKIVDLNGVCNDSSWRRPTFNELANLMMFTGESGLLDSSVFTAVKIDDSSEQYWFKGSEGSTDSQLLSFNQGQITSGTSGLLLLVSDTNALLKEQRPTDTYSCAEDLQTPDPDITSNHRYTVNDDEITDNTTGLTWVARSLLTSDSDANPNWGAALEQADTYSGESSDGTGWRAPTIKELLSIVTLNCDSTGVAIKTNLPYYFRPHAPGGMLLPLMSSSPVNNANGEIWTLDLTNESQLLLRSAPPSTGLEMQTFVVKSPAP
jgi:hypothetical protein